MQNDHAKFYFVTRAQAQIPVIFATNHSQYTVHRFRVLQYTA